MTSCLEKYQNNIKKSWDAIKEIIRRVKSTKGSFPKRMIIEGHEIFEIKEKQQTTSTTSM